MTGFAHWYSVKKQYLLEETGATETLLHVHAGLLIFVAASLLLRKRMRSPWPIVLVGVFAVVNEIVDSRASLAHVAATAGAETLADIANTAFWPLVLFLAARRWPDTGATRVRR